MLNEKEILNFIEEQKKMNQLLYSNVMDNGRMGHRSTTNVSTLTDYSSDLLYEICLLQLGITDDEV